MMQSLGETRIADVETCFLLLVAKYLSFGFFLLLFTALKIESALLNMSR